MFLWEKLVFSSLKRSQNRCQNSDLAAKVKGNSGGKNTGCKDILIGWLYILLVFQSHFVLGIFKKVYKMN